MTATLPPYPCLCSFASLSCVSSCSSAIGLAAGALQSLASSQRVGLTHYVKSFCPWGSQQWAMERWLSPVSTLALTDGYLSPLRLWWPKAPVCWCWVRRTAAQTKGRAVYSSPFISTQSLLPDTITLQLGQPWINHIRFDLTIRKCFTHYRKLISIIFFSKNTDAFRSDSRFC